MRLTKTVVAGCLLIGPVLAWADEAPAPVPVPANALTYGNLGVVELGGFVGLDAAPNVRDLNISPMLGYFVAEHLELSLIGTVADIKSGMDETTMYSALIEPSLHLPFDPKLFGFIGVGAGAAYVNKLGTAMAFAPRLGLNVVLGESSVLTPSLSYEYTMHDATTALDSAGVVDVTRAAISSALRVNVGYSVIW